MTPSLAKKRYFKTTALSMTFYVIAIFSVSFFLAGAEVPAFVKYALALLPTLFVWWFLWGAYRFYKETDEFERSRLISSMLAGVVAILIISSGWGFVEMLADGPHLPVFWILPIFFLASGLYRAFTRSSGEGC